jgi:hypothetical protein
MIKTAVWFFLAGLIVAIALEVLWRTLGYYSPVGYVVERISRFLWPSAFFKTVLNEGKDPTAQASPVYSLSFIANGVLYGVFGLLIGSVKNILLRPK